MYRPQILHFYPHNDYDNKGTKRNTPGLCPGTPPGTPSPWTPVACSLVPRSHADVWVRMNIEMNIMNRDKER